MSSPRAAEEGGTGKSPLRVAWFMVDAGDVYSARWTGIGTHPGAGGRRLSSRRLGSASFRAPGMATWSGDSAGERCGPAGHPQGVPRGYRGLGVSKKFPTLAKNTGRLETAFPVGDWKSPLLAKNTGRLERRPSQSARETRRSKWRPEGRRSQSAPRTTPLRTTPLLPGVRHWKFQRKRRRGDRKVPPPRGVVHGGQRGRRLLGALDRDWDASRGRGAATF